MDEWFLNREALFPRINIFPWKLLRQKFSLATSILAIMDVHAEDPQLVF